jgi:hypothetical protein
MGAPRAPNNSPARELANPLLISTRVIRNAAEYKRVLNIYEREMRICDIVSNNLVPLNNNESEFWARLVSGLN